MLYEGGWGGACAVWLWRDIEVVVVQCVMWRVAKRYVLPCERYGFTRQNHTFRKPKPYLLQDRGDVGEGQALLSPFDVTALLERDGVFRACPWWGKGW